MLERSARHSLCCWCSCQSNRLSAAACALLCANGRYIGLEHLSPCPRGLAASELVEVSLHVFLVWDVLRPHQGVCLHEQVQGMNGAYAFLRRCARHPEEQGMQLGLLFLVELQDAHELVLQNVRVELVRA